MTGTAPIQVATGSTTPVVSIDAATTSTPGSMSASDKTKLDGVAAGATANSSDATLLARANHTGTQLASTISDFADTVRATVLTGIDLATNSAVTATDTVLSAIGKLFANITAHKADTANPHATTKTQVGLGNADNTSDLNKPVSTAQQTALDLKADITAVASGYQPLDSDLTAIAALTTTAYGRALLALADAAAGRTALGAQEVLVSATNIKTVGGTSILGSGNIAVGDVTLTGTQTLTNKTITETVYTVTGTTPALTATNGAVQQWTLTANSTPTDALTSGQSIILMIDDGTAYSVTWPSVSWTKQGGGGAAPTLSATLNTCVVLWKVGATLYGSHLGDA